ncbi:MAG: uroporphyrinogen-III C-methyltransferase, partial [Coxiellaceae bacterium]|nr:uroporphyrinogen-III C-methyltransferase [Coxiellaceae bacterium]
NSLATLKHAVVIRRVDQPIQPLLTPLQHHYLIENIQLQLNLAAWAVINRNEKIYNRVLSQAEKQIAEQLKQSDATMALLSGIAALKTIDVAPQVPTVDGSLRAVERAVINSEKAQPSMPPATPTMKKPDSTPQVISS